MNPADQQTLAQLYPALRTALAPLDAQEASYFAASDRIASLSCKVRCAMSGKICSPCVLRKTSRMKQMMRNRHGRAMVGTAFIRQT